MKQQVRFTRRENLLFDPGTLLLCVLGAGIFLYCIIAGIIPLEQIQWFAVKLAEGASSIKG
jgi:hypothetical protein